MSGRWNVQRDWALAGDGMSSMLGMECLVVGVRLSVARNLPRLVKPVRIVPENAFKNVQSSQKERKAGAPKYDRNTSEVRIATSAKKARQRQLGHQNMTEKFTKKK